MNHTTPNETLNTPQDSAGDAGTREQRSKQSQRKWVRLPDELPKWLSSRIELSVPVWALAIAMGVLLVLILD